MPERPKKLNAPTIVSTRNVDERLCDPPADAIPSDSQIHTRWVRNDPNRISEMKYKYGYETAKESDIVSVHGGYIAGDDTIQKGDLVLMKTGRDVTDQNEENRRAAIADMDRQINRSDRSNGIEDRPSHNIRRARRGARSESKTYNIPINLKK